MRSKSTTTTDFRRPSDIPPLRDGIYVPDAYDAERVAFITSLWTGQDGLLRNRDRQVEENIRMLHGQQWIVWSNLRGRFVNLAEHMTDDEKRWRHMPVLNRLLVWFVLTHARMTENPPVLTWQPGPDRIDEMLAQVCDPVYKYIWRDTGMLEILDRLFSWMIPGGRAYLKSRIDPFKGDPIPTRGPAVLQLLDAAGQPIRRTTGGEDDEGGEFETREFEDVPHAINGEGRFAPAVEMRQNPDDESDFVPTPLPGMAPESLYEGGFAIDVLTCLEARGEWGQTPWHQKGWHIHKSLLTPMQAWDAFGIELEPDVTGAEAESSGVLWRMLKGAGLFGAAEGRRGNEGSSEEFCTIYEAWMKPSRFPGTERTDESAGGRLTIVSGSGKVIRDGVRSAPFKYTSPIRAFDFVGIPGRSQGTSPQEFMNGPVRTRNRLFAQKVAHATLASNPIRVVDRSQGLEQGQVPNTPGAEILADRSKSKNPAVEYVGVPALGQDVDQASAMLRAEIDELGSIAGAEGSPPTKDSSGVLVKELRFNSDRPIAATMRRAVIELGRMGEDWVALAPTVWDREKILSIVGDDNISRTITVYPMLFQQGSVHVEPEVESMLPEGRGERQERAFMFWKEGVWGDPKSSEARAMFLDLARFPHLSRFTRPGGVDRTTAEQNVGAILQGAPAAAIEVFPWYNFDVHIYVLELYLKAPEFKQLEPEMKKQFVAYWTKLKASQADALVLERLRQIEVESAAAAGKIRAQGDLQRLTGAVNPAPPPPAPGQQPTATRPGEPAPDGGPSPLASADAAA